MLAVLLLSTVTQALPGSWEVGYATWYTGVPNGGGSCEFPKEVTASFPFGMYAAIDYTLYDDSKACGVCYEVECTGNPSWTTELCECKATSVVLQADSSCCTRDHNTPHFDLNPAARAAILQNDCGNMAVRFRQVACTYNSEGKNVQIVPKPGTTEWWYAFFVWDVAETGQVVKARIKSSGSSTWNDCPLKGGAFFECGGTKPYTAPFTVELTDIEGEVLVAGDLITDPSKTGSWDFGTNFGKGTTTGNGNEPPGSTPSTAVNETDQNYSNKSDDAADAVAWVAVTVGILLCMGGVVAIFALLKSNKPAGRVPMSTFLENTDTEAYHEMHADSPVKYI